MKDKIYFRPPEKDSVAEDLFDRIEKKNLAESQAQFEDSITEKVWRTKDGRYIEISKMDDNHLFNSFKITSNNLLKVAVDEGYTNIGNFIKGSTSRLDKSYTVTLINSYTYLKEEMSKRNLQEKKAEEVFDLFDNIINSREDDTQQ